MENSISCIFLCMLIMNSSEIGHSSLRLDAAEVVSNQCQISNHSASYALIPYTPAGGVLSQFYEPEKTFNFPNINRSIVIRQDWSSNGVAGVVWEAAYVLSHFIASNFDLNGKSVLELGAGTGLVGMTAAAMGAKVICTDLAKALPLLQKNIDLNFSPDDAYNYLSVAELEWGKDYENFRSSYDYVFGADIIYMEDSFNDLITTLCHLSHNNETKIYLAAKLRYDRVEQFLRKLNKFFAHIRKVKEDSTSHVVVYECH